MRFVLLLTGLPLALVSPLAEAVIDSGSSHTLSLDRCPPVLWWNRVDWGDPDLHVFDPFSASREVTIGGDELFLDPGTDLICGNGLVLEPAQGAQASPPWVLLPPVPGGHRVTFDTAPWVSLPRNVRVTLQSVVEDVPSGELTVEARYSPDLLAWSGWFPLEPHRATHRVVLPQGERRQSFEALEFTKILTLPRNLIDAAASQSHDHVGWFQFRVRRIAGDGPITVRGCVMAIRWSVSGLHQ